MSKKAHVVIARHKPKTMTRSLSIKFHSDITNICTEYRDPLRVRGKERKRERGRKRERASEI